VTGVGVTYACVDKGCGEHGCNGLTRVHIAGSSSKKKSRSERKRRRRRSAIEPKIGHLKNDHRVRRCFLSRLKGDAINTIRQQPRRTSGSCRRDFVARFATGSSARQPDRPGPPARRIPQSTSPARHTQDSRRVKSVFFRNDQCTTR